MLNSAVITFLAFGLLTCVFALVKGGKAERLGAGVILANLVLMFGLQAILPPSTMSVVQLGLDAVTAVALLGLAVLYASFWLGAVMMLYAVQFALHAYYFVSERPVDLFHARVNNLDFFAICIALALGTFFAARKRAAQP